MFYNWYDPADGSVVTVWPEDGSTVTPFLSSVDNGWLAAALMVVKGAVPELRGKADRILRPMDFGFYFNPAATSPIGDARPDPRRLLGHPAARAARCAQDGVWFTCNHYDITVTEPRIATYIGIAPGQIPPTRVLRHDAHAAGELRLQLAGDAAGRASPPPTSAVTVYEGAYRYRGIRFVPSWGGDMFEALMPDLFVPEAQLGPAQLGPQPPGDRAPARSSTA